MTSHFGLLIVFSGFVALTFAVLMRDQPVSQLRFGFTLLAWLVGVAVVFGWLM